LSMVMASKFIGLPTRQASSRVRPAPIVPTADEFSAQVDGAISPVGSRPAGRADAGIKEGILPRRIGSGPNAGLAISPETDEDRTIPGLVDEASATRDCLVTDGT
jgi:hypothetical protein